MHEKTISYAIIVTNCRLGSRMFCTKIIKLNVWYNKYKSFDLTCQLKQLQLLIITKVEN